MDQLVERCAGLDVHRDTVVATVRRPRPGGGRASKTLTFATTTAELTALGDWLGAEEVDLVGMESTGVYAEAGVPPARAADSTGLAAQRRASAQRSGSQDRRGRLG